VTLLLLVPQAVRLDTSGLPSKHLDHCAVCVPRLPAQARLAANKAFLQGLGLGPAALQGDGSGSGVPPLAPTHTAVIKAAQQLARQAALDRAKRQLSRSQRLLDARRSSRRGQEVRLRAALDALAADEAAAVAQVAAALQVYEDMQHEMAGGAGREG
jgi:hypothetical protein